MIEFLALATGGPVHYQGKEMKSAHANMQISNPEFDSVVGDLKASLDKLQIPNQEQKELLAIIESTRPEIVTEREESGNHLGGRRWSVWRENEAVSQLLREGNSTIMLLSH